MKNIICFLFGHRPNGAAYHGYGNDRCEKCNSEDEVYYQGEWTNKERFGVVGWFFYRLRQRYRQSNWRKPLPRCYHCGKMLIFRKKYNSNYCNKGCWEAYCPF